MRFRASIVHVVVAGLPAVGCDSNPTPPPAKTDTVAKTEPPKPDVKAEPPKPDVKAEPPEPDVKPEPPKPIIVETPDDIPVALGGVAMPYEPPTPPPPAKAAGAGGAAPAPAPAAEAPSAAAAAAPAARPTAVAIAHRHAPGEPCSALSREEVERALADLRE